MKIYALLLAVLLVGCTTADRIVEVKVAIPVPCQVVEPKRPAMPTEILPIESEIDVMLRHFRAEILVRDAYEGELVTAIRSCLE